MAFSVVAWAYRDIFTSAKGAQMEENLRAHDHYTAGQGARIFAREIATGTVLVGNAGIAANANAETVVNLPAGRFAAAPKVVAVIAGIPSGSYVGRHARARATTAAQTTIVVTNGAAALAAGLGMTVHWIAVEL